MSKRTRRSSQAKNCKFDNVNERCGKVHGLDLCMKHYQKFDKRRKAGFVDPMKDLDKDLREVKIYSLDMEPEEELAHLIHDQERDLRYGNFAFPGTGEAKVDASYSKEIGTDGFTLLDILEFRDAEKALYGGTRRYDNARTSDW